MLKPIQFYNPNGKNAMFDEKLEPFNSAFSLFIFLNTVPAMVLYGGGEENLVYITYYDIL